MAITQEEYEVLNRKNINKYSRRIKKIIDKAIQEASAIGASISDFDPNKTFRWQDYPQTSKRIKKILNTLRVALKEEINKGVEDNWKLGKDSIASLKEENNG